jgi:hypothetical protein
LPRTSCDRCTRTAAQLLISRTAAKDSTAHGTSPRRRTAGALTSLLTSFPLRPGTLPTDQTEGGFHLVRHRGTGGGTADARVLRSSGTRESPQRMLWLQARTGLGAPTTLLEELERPNNGMELSQKSRQCTIASPHGSLLHLQVYPGSSSRAVLHRLSNSADLFGALRLGLARPSAP